MSKLEAVRKAAGMTQEEAARAYQLSFWTYSSIEKLKIAARPTHREKISRNLGVEKWQLFWDDGFARQGVPEEHMVNELKALKQTAKA